MVRGWRSIVGGVGLRGLSPTYACFPWFAKVEDDFLALLARIIDSCPAAPGRGLPIGSLTSQHFANHYLDGANRFLLDHPLVCAHVRYMDDTLWWGHERESVRQVLAELRVWLANERRLRLKAAFQINRSERGVTWCGARMQRGYDAVHAAILHTDSATWRKRHLELHPSRYSDQ